MTSNDTLRHTRLVSFGLGAALGSALGMLLGSVITYWLGEMTVRAVRQGIRRMSGADDQPNFESLAQ